MALFNASALLDDKKEPITITCDFFNVPDGVEYPTVTIEMSDKLRDVYRSADAKYRFATKYTFKKGHKQPIGEITNDPIQFCYEILNEGFRDSEGLFDQSSKKAILALVKKEPMFARKMASKLVEVFEHDDLYAEETDDTKN